MRNEISKLLEEIRVTRARILGEVSALPQDQGSKKPNLESWNIQEVLEHLVLAERGSFDLICTAAERFRNGNPAWTGISENDNMPIEEIIQRTWKPKEKAPESASPTPSMVQCSIRWNSWSNSLGIQEGS